MGERITRRDALRLGTNVAMSAAVAPLLPRNVVMGGGASEMTEPRTGAPDPVCFLPAVEMARLIREKKLSAREAMEAHLKQIKRVNEKVNAVVTQVREDELMAQARAADESLAGGKLLGPLHGMPVGVKDLHETKGIRTIWITFVSGSRAGFRLFTGTARKECRYDRSRQDERAGIRVWIANV